MVAAASLSGSNLPIRVGDTLLIGVRPPPPGAATTKSSTTHDELTAAQGARTVGTALDKATKIFGTLSSLQETLKQADDPATTPRTKAETDALNAKLAKLTAEIDTLAAEAKVGKSNLLSNEAASVTVKTASGLKVTVAAQSLDSKGLGLSDLKVTDARSAREALGRVGLAVGQSQLAVFRLQTADGATGTAAPGPAAKSLESVKTALANQAAAFSIDYADSSAATTSKAVESVKTALANQASANSINYSNAATARKPSATGTILDLFG